MYQSSLINSVSFVFCVFNRVASGNEGINIILLRSSIQIPKKETQDSYSRSTNVHVNMPFPNSNFEGNFSNYFFGKPFWHYREIKIDFWTWWHILYKKILNTFLCVEDRILVEKLNVYEGHIFQRPLLQICRLETTTLCLNTRLRVNKKFSNFNNFYWN